MKFGHDLLLLEAGAPDNLRGQFIQYKQVLSSLVPFPTVCMSEHNRQRVFCEQARVMNTAHAAWMAYTPAGVAFSSISTASMRAAEEAAEPAARRGGPDVCRAGLLPAAARGSAGRQPVRPSLRSRSQPRDWRCSAEPA